MSMRTAVRLTLAVAAIAVWPATARAQTLSLTAGLPVTLSPFQPGKTATGSGLLTLTATTSTWTLQVQDSGPGAGRLRAASTGCAGSSPQLDNPLRVTVTSSSPVNSAGPKTIGATPTTVASGRSLVLSAITLTTSYTVDIPATQVMRTGCAYDMSITYTVQ